MRAPAALLVVLGAAALAGCQPRGVLTQSQVFDFVRDDLASACCNCLASSHQSVPHPAFVCPGALPDDIHLARVDGGYLDDGTEPPPDLVLDTPCLCGTDTSAGTCRARLSRGGDEDLPGDAGPAYIDIVGLCVDVAGVCHAECDGVLAYP